MTLSYCFQSGPDSFEATIQAFFLPENHPNPLDQNAAEMSFGLLEMSFGVLEMSFGVLEMSFGVLEMSFEDIAGGFCALEISYGYQWKKRH